MSARRQSAVGAILFVLFGPLVWAMHLLVAYGGHASLCAAGDRLPFLDAGALPWLLWGTTVAALALLVAGLVWPAAVERLLGGGAPIAGERRFQRGVMRLLTFLSIAGVVFAAAAILLLPLCTQLR